MSKVFSTRYKVQLYNGISIEFENLFKVSLSLSYIVDVAQKYLANIFQQLWV